jgi:hypothetical protein
MSFETLESAAFALLMTTCDVLNRSNVRYVIAGGWVPILLGGPAGLAHPGTRDVDVLLGGDISVLYNRDPDRARVVVQYALETLLDEGFRVSAKHEFQLLKEVKVGDHVFVFNVDLMHPIESQLNPSMYADIFDLGVADAYDVTGKRWIKSIAFRSSALVFQRNLIIYKTVDGVDLNQNQISLSIPLLSPGAFVLSKSQSLRIPKRTRDAFDLFYILSGPQGNATQTELASLRDFGGAPDPIADLQQWLSSPADFTSVITADSNAGIFNWNVRHHGGEAVGRISEDPAKFVAGILASLNNP